jgi:hypothetical protein
MILAMLMVFALVVAMVVNVGQAVNRRVALQLVADAGAYTGASKMAEGLNYMAFANKRIQDLWAGFNAAWSTASLIPPLVPGVSGGSCDALSGVVGIYNGLRAPYATAYRTLNAAYSILPYEEARAISERNVDQLFPGERARGQFSFREVLDPLNQEEGLPRLRPRIPPTSQRDVLDFDNLPLPPQVLVDSEDVPNGTVPNAGIPNIGFLRNSRTRYTWWCWTTCGPCPLCIPCPQPRTFNPGVWFQKESTDPNFFVWRVRVRETPALMFNSFFGPLPSMTAVAVAKPIGGTIRNGNRDGQYVTKLVPVSQIMLGGGFIIDSNFTGPGGVRRVTH